MNNSNPYTGIPLTLRAEFDSEMIIISRIRIIFYRKNIVDKMTESFTDAAEMQRNVEELGDIETKIARVQGLMKDAEKRGTYHGAL